MNEEIKEILDYFKDDIEFLEEELKNPNFLGRYITIRDKECSYLKLLLDYITNLQEIAEEHKNCTRKHWQEKCAEHYANEMIYKSRNEKAIEFIKKHQRKDEFLNLNEWQARDLLNILQGSNNK